MKIFVYFKELVGKCRKKERGLSASLKLRENHTGRYIHKDATQIDACCSPCGLGKNCSCLDDEDCIILVYMCQVNKILNVK